MDSNLELEFARFVRFVLWFLYMAWSIRGLYPDKFKAKEAAWSTLIGKKEPSLNDIRNVLNSEADLFSAINNGRTYLDLQPALNLETKDGRIAALKWFGQQKSIIQIANQNMLKASRMNKKVIPMDNYKNVVEACDRAIRVLLPTIDL